MYLYIFLLSLCSLCSSVVSSNSGFFYPSGDENLDSLVDTNFEYFMDKFNIYYDDVEEYFYRKYVFSTNYIKIIEHNAKNHGYKLGLNRFSDMTVDEYAETLLTLSGPITGPKNKPYDKSYHKSYHKSYKNGTLPSSVDWRKSGKVNAVKDQGNCGSCWAFSATSALESAYAIKYGKLYNLAEQELVDCDTVDQGCNGGLMDNAWQWVSANGGMMKTSDYPYKASESGCKFEKNKTVVNVKSYKDVLAGDEQAVITALAQQPVSVAINANVQTFMFYESGVYNDTSCDQGPSALDHGVVLVGYAPTYYILRNSWGTYWGEDGYMRMARGNTCGVLDAVSFPVV